MFNVIRHQRMFGMVVGLLAACVCLTSCEPLRKKFVRQKKRSEVENTDFVPVLEPQEYLAPENNPVANYTQHYAVIKTWYTDLWTALEEENSDKKQKYTINQILNHIAEMRKLVEPKIQEELDQLSGLLKYHSDSLSQPQALRNKYRIESDLRAFDRLLRRLRGEKLEGHFVKPA